jgi:radical SAM superfamily enzyme YgiQ (UPF0313 family)
MVLRVKAHIIPIFAPICSKIPLQMKELSKTMSGTRLERSLLHRFVLILRSIASRGVEAATPMQLWNNESPVRLLWVQPGVFDRSRRKLIHHLNRGKPMLGGLKVNSLAYLASLTPGRVAQVMVDDNLEEFDFDKIKRLNVNLAAISSMTMFVPRAYEIAGELRMRGIKTILGGPHATLCPDEARRYVDTVVVGEAENIWETVLEDFQNGCMKPIYRSENFVNPEAFKTPDSRILPYQPFGIDSVQATRGCPHNCKFCCVTILYGHKLRKRPIDDVLAQVRKIQARNLNVFFTDDNIVGDREYAIELFKGLIDLQQETGKELLWGAQSTLLLAEDEEILELASKSGCSILYLGFESLSRNALAKANKRHNSPERYREAMKALQKRSIRVAASLITGLPGEDRKSSEEMFRLLIENDVHLIYYYILTPLPGTDLRREFDEKKLLTNRNRWDHYDTLHVNFDPQSTSNGASFSANELEQTIWRYYDSFYRYRYIARRLIRNFGRELIQPTVHGRSMGRAFRRTMGDMYFSLVSRLLVMHRLHPFETP